MPTCCAVGCSSSIAKGDKLFLVPRGKNDQERRAVWLHRIGRKNFDCHRGRLCEVSSHYRTSSRRHASGRLSDEAQPWFRFMLNKSSLKFPSTLSRTISTTMTARSFLACSDIRIRFNIITVKCLAFAICFLYGTICSGSNYTSPEINHVFDRFSFFFSLEL